LQNRPKIQKRIISGQESKISAALSDQSSPKSVARTFKAKLLAKYGKTKKFIDIVSRKSDI
jgi:hypothetical protein